ncbi:MAG: hypothetical protein WB566_17740 [Terriglobales bacterium]
MNPLASTKCVRRVVMALAAISGIVLGVGCGSSSSTSPNSNGFSKSNLTGTYVIAVSGLDITSTTESFFAVVGTIAADGKGGLTGTVDINDPDLGGTGLFLGQTVGTSSGYSISPDGRGSATLVTPKKAFGFDFVLTSTGHGLITRFDNNGTGSGTLDIQGTATQGSLASLVFSLSGGVNSDGNSIGTVGAFTLNSSGTITPAGIQDVNENGSSIGELTGLPLTGSLVLGSSNSGTAQLNTTFGALTFDVWAIDSTHLKLIETDGSGLTLSGDAFTQQSSFTPGQLVYTLGGLDSTFTNPVVAGGFVTTDAQGTLSNGLEDFNDDGSIINTVQNFGGSCTTFTAGRCQLTLPSFSNGSAQTFQFAAYPSSGGVQMLEIDGHGLLQGAAYAQTATTFAASTGYGLNLTGANSNGEVDDIAQFNAGAPGTTSTTTPNMTGVLDENDLGSGLFSANLSGIYVPDSPATGRGSITIPNINTLNGTINLEYYVVDGSTILLIEGDSGQVALGMFQLQGASSAVSAAQSHISVVRAIVRPHAALTHK